MKFVYFFRVCGPNFGVSGQELFSPSFHNGQELFLFLALQWRPLFLILFLSEKLLSVWSPLAVMAAFSIATLNVDGIRDDDKRARIFEYL